MEIWDHKRLKARRALEGSRRRQQQPTACREMRGIACGVWLRSSWRTESRMPLKKAAQLGVSGLGRHVAVKRAGRRGGRRTCRRRRATAGWHAKKPTVASETKGGVGVRACMLQKMQKCAHEHRGGKRLPERTRSIPCAVCACSDRTDARRARRATAQCTRAPRKAKGVNCLLSQEGALTLVWWPVFVRDATRAPPVTRTAEQGGGNAGCRFVVNSTYR
jgi:hypothetical protein